MESNNNPSTTAVGTHYCLAVGNDEGLELDKTDEDVRYRYALGPEHPDLTVYIATQHTRRLPDTSTPQDRPRATIPHGDIQCHPFCL